jgi:FKBP-type peptidyl-prolyl cis-trans isomerase FklB
MKKLLIGTATVSLLAFAGQAQEKPELTDTKDKISYIIGSNVGRDLKRQGVEVDPEVLLRGIRDAISGAEPLLSQQELQETLTALQQEIRTRMQAEQQAQSERSKKEGEQFLAENAKKPAVHTLPSGLQYKVIHQGTGPSPKATDTVVVHYRGTLIDGTEFDSSYKNGQPATFPVNGVIKGWTEALQLMNAGAKWQLFIPADLAYGPRPRPNIPANSTLIFDVELIAISQAQEDPVSGEVIRVPSAEELKKGAKIEAVKPPQPEKK